MLLRSASLRLTRRDDQEKGWGVVVFAQPSVTGIIGRYDVRSMVETLRLWLLGRWVAEGSAASPRPLAGVGIT